MTAVDCVYSIEGSGPALFMVHGIGARRATWAGLIDQFSKDFTCISYDLRGHGESPVPTGLFTLSDLVDDLEALREKLDIDRAHVIGHSLGGMIGPAYARVHPERVLSLGLLSTAAGRTDEDRAKVLGVIEAMEEKGIERVLETLVERWYTDHFIDTRPEAIRARIKQVIDTPAQIFMNVFRIYAETEMAPWLHEVAAPSLVLTGELDGGCNPRLNRFIADELPNSELVILDGLKHSILIEAPDRVSTEVGRFLSLCR
ncbi:alpha/beta fold hydrolase [Pelagibius sp. Alg239-R121]|uniref:alpha/beta fold hydrolase n=1 Tax=Pelagibius sp. Alg239-R121 TaxID=2993448 RepID=UPI0024A7604F|nr:alpha/beta hydrolase [Pelagibius sp. Alg239-R121]